MTSILSSVSLLRFGDESPGVQGINGSGLRGGCPDGKRDLRAE
eukprot:CAMPEP_0180614570 /NCGR_PEP_ID=MMETSP1037_2-20121125/31484_1 /TAXON_ID=632150 /ORGANISM="Azadinium spinosum, Strain 3D9" /LENGTH=42 /DNA_ID= /DNA_START= /DNA_END= /DNA_ORIENTATION=